MMTDITIRAVESSDFGQWLKLYHGYAKHYNVSLTDDIIETTWGWLMDASHPVHGLVAIRGGVLIGLAHIRPMPSPLRGQYVGFLDDLFVDHGQRGHGVVDVLMTGLKVMAEKQGWTVIRWITRDNNYRARSVYDKYATKTDWNLYEMSC
jgi:hypothetical protein